MVPESPDSGFALSASRNDVSLLSEDVNVSTASNDEFDNTPRIARVVAICSIAVSRHALAKNPPPAPAGFKPELS
jgi:hypothetical protein